MEIMDYHTKRFMWKELSLGGVMLMVYSIIYSFSQGEGVGFYGSQNTLAEITGVSVSTIKRTLASLCESGLIEKTQSGAKCVYKCKTTEPEEPILDVELTPLTIPCDVAREEGISLSSRIIKKQHSPRYPFFPVGSKGVLSMTSEQYSALLSLTDEQTLTAYISKLENAVLNKGYRVNNPYKTLRKWIYKDTRV